MVLKIISHHYLKYILENVLQILKRLALLRCVNYIERENESQNPQMRRDA